MKGRKLTFGKFLEYLMIVLVIVNVGIALTSTDLTKESSSDEDREFSENCDSNCHEERIKLQLLEEED